MNNCVACGAKVRFANSLCWRCDDIRDFGGGVCALVKQAVTNAIVKERLRGLTDDVSWYEEFLKTVDIETIKKYNP